MKTLSYLSFLTFFTAVTVPIGSVPYLLLGYSFRIPAIGRVLGYVLHDLSRVTLVVKLASWFASASGVIVGYLLCQRIVGAPNNRYQWYAIVVITAVTILHLSSRIITFDLFDVTKLTKFTSKFAPSDVQKQFESAEPRYVSMLVHQNFAELTFIPLLQLLASLGVLLFALANLHVLRTKSGALPSLFDCVVSSLSIMSLAPTDSVAFTGAVWLALRLVTGIILLVWAVAFLNFSRDALPKEGESRSALGLASATAPTSVVPPTADIAPGT